MSKSVRATARVCAQNFPTAAVAIITAVLAPFGAGIAAGLAALVGAGAWAGTVRRRSTIVPAPGQFIGS
ncbi:MAG: hypothetical protein AVDCRST_MAG04-3818 [uncultured Acetobacteraceae bacterium]|jgi:hypothetical protein|uniref:Uncharacterized protein n=1 Tax=uncultured Acetobacteraceae bacterium TaxID=169975 RepID=A0A6J4JM59_9PROT|nr:MAG: hypothetical protein AVDCRST_MAG04-3818 [uncultured Acetobacteraceae bacterium]